MISRQLFPHIVPSIRVVCIALFAVVFAVAAGCDKPKTDGDTPKPEHEPRITPDKMPAGFTTLTIGVSDEAALTALLGPPSVRSVDRSFGGDMSVMRNDKPAIVVEWKSEAYIRRYVARLQLPETALASELAAVPNRLPTAPPYARYESVSASFVSLADGKPPVLVSLEATAAAKEGEKTLCAWLDEGIGADPRATKCPGTNRVFGKQKSDSSYCGGNAAGDTNLFVDCYPAGKGNDHVESLRFWLSFK